MLMLNNEVNKNITEKNFKMLEFFEFYIELKLDLDLYF